MPRYVAASDIADAAMRARYVAAGVTPCCCYAISASAARIPPFVANCMPLPPLMLRYADAVAVRRYAMMPSLIFFAAYDANDAAIIDCLPPPALYTARYYDTPACATASRAADERRCYYFHYAMLCAPCCRHADATLFFLYAMPLLRCWSPLAAMPYAMMLMFSHAARALPPTD